MIMYITLGDINQLLQYIWHICIKNMHKLYYHNLIPVFDYKITSVNSQHAHTQIQNIILYSKVVLKSSSDLVWRTQLIAFKA